MFNFEAAQKTIDQQQAESNISDDTILVIDDEPQNRKIYESIIGSRYKVLSAPSGEIGLELSAQHDISCVLTDECMPGLQGSEVCSMLEKRHHRATRIILTGFAGLSNIVDVVNNGAIFRYLTKPIEADALIEATHAAVADFHRRQQNLMLLAKTKELMEEHARLITRLEHAQIPYTTELESALSLGAPKRCQLAILFCSLVGLDEILKLEPTIVAEILGPIISTIHRQIYGAGGIVDKNTSRGLMAIFGLGSQSTPSNTASAIENLVKSFPAVCHSIARHKGRPEALNLKLAVGATFGQVLLGTVGSKNKMELAVVGPGANLAARLTELAEGSLVSHQGLVDPHVTSALAVTTPNILSHSFTTHKTIKLKENASVRSFPDVRDLSIISV